MFNVARRRLPRVRPLIAIALIAMLVLPAAISPAGSVKAALALAPNQSGLYLNKWDCPGTFGGDFGQLLANCTVVNNVTFDVFGPNYQDTFQGGFSLSAMPAGNYTIREYIPQGYREPTVFCGFAASNDQQPVESQVVTYDGYYEFQLGDNQSIYCNWFNVPIQAPADVATLIINKHSCPSTAEFDAYSASIYDLAANCNGATGPVDFTVSSNGAQLASGTTQGAPNLLTLDLPIGNIEVVESIPDGYGEPVVYCSVKDGLGNDRAPVTQAQMDNDRIYWQLNSGDVVFCDWFNVPAEQLGTISVVKLICPDTVGYDWSGSYSEDCTDTAADVSLKLDGASTGNPGNQLTDANGQITWSEREADHYYLSEEVPSGYGRPVVYCAYYDPAASQDRDYQSYSVSSENQIEFDLAEGQHIACLWFNIVENPQTPTPVPTTSTTPTSDSASFKIIAYTCQPGYDLFADQADPQEDCPDASDGIEFQLSGDGGQKNGRSGDDDSGSLVFAGLKPGAYQLVEKLPSEVASAFVYNCSSNARDLSDYPFTPFALIGANGTLGIALVAGEDLACTWYHVPFDTGTATVTITKQWCSGQSVNPASCDIYADGIELTLSPTDGNSDGFTEITDEDGIATFEIPAGKYTLEEEGDIHWCFGSSDAFASDGSLHFEAGDEVEVLIYNCGDQP